jgi:rSAM/selenodomain-associated transferase 2
MTASVTVIIPTLDEERRIARAIDSAFAAGAREVIVADCGSSDATTTIARDKNAIVIEGDAMRSRQMNRAAERATSDHLIFLHADTTLPLNAASLVSKFDFGGFRISFAERSMKLRIAAALINLRTRITRCPWGDQAQFIRRDLFLGGGGFREIAIMEDYELAIRMKRRAMLLDETVETSGRRFLEKGLIRTAAINWWIIARYRTGADPDALADMYRK